MILATKDLADNTEINASPKEHVITNLKLPGESAQALEVIDTDSNQLAGSNNIKSMPRLQRYYQQTKLAELIEQNSTMLTPEQIQQLQTCVQEIAAIIYEQTSARERKRFQQKTCRLIKY